MANAAELYEAMDLVIEKNAEGTHIQEVWVTAEGSYDQGLFNNCGTAGCLAGWKVMMDGFTEPIFANYGPNTRYVVALRNPETGVYVRSTDIAEYAANAFGIDDDLADLLFHQDNTLEQLKHYVDLIASGEIS